MRGTMRLRESDPQLVIVGMVSEVQRQIAEARRASGLRNIGFSSGFDPPAPDSIFSGRR